MTTPMNLVEYSKGLEPGMQKAVVEIYAKTSDILEVMPFKTVKGPYQYQVEGTLPGIAFRGVNSSYTSDTSVENPQVEPLFISGGDADVDMFLLALDESRRARETNKKLKNQARVITNAVLKGDNSASPLQFDGLQRRLKSTGSQFFTNNAAAGGGALSLAMLDAAIDQCQEPTHIIMNRDLRTKFNAAIRNQTLAGNMRLDKDSFGRPQMTYNGLPLLVGYEAGPDAKILPFTEVATGGGGAVTSSLYVVSFGEGNVCGIQLAPPRVADLGEIQASPVKRVRVEWYNGMVLENPYAASRLSSITNAAIVA
jgi:hypothetical protein